MEKQYQLPKEFAEKWIEALRSADEKKHHTGELRHETKMDCFCGIGIGMVANDITISDDGRMIVIDGKRVDYFEKFIFNGKLAYDFVNQNDQRQLSYLELASWLEQNVEFI